MTKIKLQPFITTLATMSIARGLAYIICQVKPVRIANESLNAVGSLQVLTVPLPVLILVVLIAVFGILLAKTEFGRNVYLVGGNPEAARLAGINVNKIKVQLFMISGAIAALGGVILAARMNSGQPGTAANVDTDAITAAVLGGIAMTGGTGTMFRHLPGVAGAADAEQRPAGAGRDDLLAECGQGRGAGLCAGAGLLPDEAPQQSKGTTAQLKLRRVAEMLCPDFAAKPRPSVRKICAQIALVP